MHFFDSVVENYNHFLTYKLNMKRDIRNRLLKDTSFVVVSFIIVFSLLGLLFKQITNTHFIVLSVQATFIGSLVIYYWMLYRRLASIHQIHNSIYPYILFDMMKIVGPFLFGQSIFFYLYLSDVIQSYLLLIDMILSSIMIVLLLVTSIIWRNELPKTRITTIIVFIFASYAYGGFLFHINILEIAFVINTLFIALALLAKSYVDQHYVFVNPKIWMIPVLLIAVLVYVFIPVRGGLFTISYNMLYDRVITDTTPHIISELDLQTETLMTHQNLFLVNDFYYYWDETNETLIKYDISLNLLQTIDMSSYAFSVVYAYDDHIYGIHPIQTFVYEPNKSLYVFDGDASFTKELDIYTSWWYQDLPIYFINGAYVSINNGYQIYHDDFTINDGLDSTDYEPMSEIYKDEVLFVYKLTAEDGIDAATNNNELNMNIMDQTGYHNDRFFIFNHQFSYFDDYPYQIKVYSAEGYLNQEDPLFIVETNQLLSVYYYDVIYINQHYYLNSDEMSVIINERGRIVSLYNDESTYDQYVYADSNMTLLSLNDKDGYHYYLLNPDNPGQVTYYMGNFFRGMLIWVAATLCFALSDIDIYLFKNRPTK